MNTKSFLSVMLLVSVLCLFPACKWFGSNQESCPGCVKPGALEQASPEDSTVIVKVDGKAVATVGDIKEAFNAIRCQQPMFDQIFNMMPADQKALIYKQILDSFADQSIIEEHVSSMKWDRTECYRKVAAQMHKMLDRQLSVNEFRKRIIEEAATLISDKDAEEFYTKNREQRLHQIPFLTNAGGVETVAVRFDREGDAKAFLDKVRVAKDLRRVAADVKRQLIEMGVVSPQSVQHDFELVGKVLGLKTFPAFDMVAGSDKKTFFVFQAIRKVDAQYAPFAQVAVKVKEVMATERFPQEYTKHMAELKGKHKIEVSEDFIKSRAGTAKEAAKAPVAA